MSDPTLEDVARLAGVSRATASRVVRGDNLVAAAKVERVQAAVSQLHYVPNRAARSLVTRRTDAIALIVPEPDSRVFSDPFFPSLISGVNKVLERTHLQLVLVMAGQVDAGDRLRRFLSGRHADGVVVASFHDNPELLDVLRTMTEPAVFIGRPPRGLDAPYIDVDNVGGARLGTQHLIDTGRRRIATITGPTDMTSGLDRLQGWREALDAAGLASHRLATGDFTLASGARAAEELLERYPDLDAIFAASDLMALGAMRVVRASGLRVPDDVALVGYDDTSLGAEQTIPLTSVTNPVGELAERATSLLLRLLDAPQPAERELIHPELKVRASG